MTVDREVNNDVGVQNSYVGASTCVYCSLLPNTCFGCVYVLKQRLLLIVSLIEGKLLLLNC
jgi:hypothetical protein